MTPEQLKTLICYDPQTGVFTRLPRMSKRGASLPSKPAGSIGETKTGRWYSQVWVVDRFYRSHRLAWFYVHGAWPTGEIDHIDGNRANNQIANLRDVSKQVNMQNLKQARSDSSSKVLGVFPNGAGWMARIKTAGKPKYLGTFPTTELAHSAYLEAKRQLHEGCTI